MAQRTNILRNDAFSIEIVRTLLHKLARGPKPGDELHPLNILKAIFWSAPGLALLFVVLTHA